LAKKLNCALAPGTQSTKTACLCAFEWATYRPKRTISRRRIVNHHIVREQYVIFVVLVWKPTRSTRLNFCYKNMVCIGMLLLLIWRQDVASASDLSFLQAIEGMSAPASSSSVPPAAACTTCPPSSPYPGDSSCSYAPFCFSSMCARSCLCAPPGSGCRCESQCPPPTPSTYSTCGGCDCPPPTPPTPPPPTPPPPTYNCKNKGQGEQVSRFEV
jgi:hypothetical protein